MKWRPKYPEKIMKLLMEEKVQVHFWVSGYDYKILTHLANTSGGSITSTLKTLIYEAEIIEKPPEKFYTEMEKINNIGNNLNQIARMANATGVIDAEYYKEVADKINEEIVTIKKICYEPRAINDLEYMIEHMDYWHLPDPKEYDRLEEIQDELREIRKRITNGYGDN